MRFDKKCVIELPPKFRIEPSTLEELIRRLRVPENLLTFHTGWSIEGFTFVDGLHWFLNE